MNIDNLLEVDLPTPEELAEGLVDPLEIDKKSFARFVYLTNADIIQFVDDPSELITSDDDAELAALFAMHVTVPSSNRYAEDHRAFAIQASIRALQDRRRVPPPVIENVPRAIGNVDVWMAQRRQVFLDKGWTPQQVDIVFSQLFMLLPEQVELLTQIPTSTLANWRQRGIGPEFIKTPGRPSIRYPAAGLITWVSGQ